MTENDQDKIIAFDTLFTTNHIQMLKILLTYLEPSRQKNMAVYIKFLELQYTLSFFKKYPSSVLPNFPRENDFNVEKFCDELLPLCAHKEQEQLKQMKNMYQGFENMQEMMQMLQMMKELFPEGENPFGGDPSQMSNIFEMLQSM